MADLEEVSENPRAAEENQSEYEGERDASHQTSGSPRNETAFIREDRRARFYENYRQVAEEYDKEFLEVYSDDLGATLTFAGLLSAVTAGFIIGINPQLWPDSNAETAALLRVLVYKIDNTTFGNDIPTLPQRTGPPPAMVQVQAILFVSLAASLGSASLLMLGKRWLNRYASSVRGSAIERCQNRQRKLDGTYAWRFDLMMQEPLPLLQTALFLLGCALSRYLWEVDTIVASVVLGATALGVFFYFFFVLRGALFETFPFQPSISHSIWQFLHFIAFNLLQPPTEETARVVVTTILSLLGPYRPGPYDQPYPLAERRFDQPPALSDSRCISWTLQTSLDKKVRFSTLEYLATAPELVGFHPTLITDCFYAFVGCVALSDSKVVIVGGSGRLAIVSARSLFLLLQWLLVTDPTSGALRDLRRRYMMIFPPEVDFTDLPFHPTMTMIDALVGRGRNHRNISWDNFSPSNQDRITFTQLMVKASWAECHQMWPRKVPRWILRFVIHSLSMVPSPPAPVITGCLTIIAMDLRCNVPDITNLDQSTWAEQVLTLITQKLTNMVEDADQRSIPSKRKAINALFPYAIHLEQREQQIVVDAILHVSRVQKFVWHHIEPCIKMWIGNSSNLFLNRALVLLSPFIGWDDRWADEAIVAGWAEAARLPLPYTEEVGCCTVDAMLQISSFESLRLHIPNDIWAWLKRQPSLPAWSRGRHKGTHPDVVRHIRSHIRRFGDVDILKSYFLVVWSERGSLDDGGLEEMEVSIRENFGGIGMQDHRKGLLERLYHVLAQLDQGVEYFKQQEPDIDEDGIRIRKGWYTKLREVLLEVDGEQ